MGVLEFSVNAFMRQECVNFLLSFGLRDRDRRSPLAGASRAKPNDHLENLRKNGL